MRKVYIGFLTGLVGTLLCGCSTPYILPHHSPETIAAGGTVVRGAVKQLDVDLSRPLVLVYAGEHVRQPFGGGLDYERTKISPPSSSYSMSRPGLVLYEKTVDALRRKGVVVERLYSEALPSKTQKQTLFLRIDEMELYLLHGEMTDRIAARAAVSLREDLSRDWQQWDVEADISAKQDIFEQLADALLAQMMINQGGR